MIIGGGTQLFDNGNAIDNFRSVAAFYFWVLVARLFGVPVVAYAQGFEAGTSRLVRGAIRMLPSVTHAISVRERESLDELGGAAARRSTEVTCDPVLGSELFLPDRVLERVPSREISRVRSMRPFMVAAFRFPPNTRQEEGVRFLRRAGRTAGELAGNRGINVVLLPALLSDAASDDRAALREVRRGLLESGLDPGRLCLLEWETLDQAACWLQAAALVFSNRLHALLVAGLANVPLVGTDPPRKIGACLNELRRFLPRCVVLRGELEFGDEQMAELHAMLDRSIDRPGRMSGEFRAYRRRHLANIRLLAGVVGR